MKQFVAILSVLLATLLLAEAARIRRDEKYTTKYDNINLDEILESDRLLDNYFKCLLEKGKCTPEGTELKSHIEDALQNDCAKCSEKQKEGAAKVIKFLYKNKPEQWKELQEKYDPNNTYTKKYEDKLKDTTS
ncbi:Ejaculatory bulb-specific protein 3 [Cryptotermes secundus]|nr:Ejaculatory bulb-specific protein 3 [Cryptotermes secundus]